MPSPDEIKKALAKASRDYTQAMRDKEIAARKERALRQPVTREELLFALNALDGNRPVVNVILALRKKWGLD